MENWDNLQYGDKLICKNDGSILQYIVYDMKKYLVSEKSMWLITEFDPNDWEVLCTDSTEIGENN